MFKHIHQINVTNSGGQVLKYSPIEHNIQIAKCYAESRDFSGFKTLILSIIVKMPTLVGILTVMSRILFMPGPW